MSTYLLDTHVILWHMTDDVQLPEQFKQLIENESHTVYISHVSLWEMAIKASIGKLELLAPFPQLKLSLDKQGFHLLPFDYGVYETLLNPPFHHKDPFDRMLIAQAMVLGCPLLSVDKIFSQYPLPEI